MLNRHAPPSNFALITVVLSLLYLLGPAALQAGEVTLAWEPNSEENLAGYKLYYDSDADSEMYQGTGANEGNSPVVIYLADLADADSPTCTLTGLTDDQYYYFALTAFDTDGLESDFSNEIGTLIGAAATLSKEVGNDDSGESGSQSSGGGCFISGTKDGVPSFLPIATIGVLFFLAGAFRGRTQRPLFPETPPPIRTSSAVRPPPDDDRRPWPPCGQMRSG